MTGSRAENIRHRLSQASESLNAVEQQVMRDAVSGSITSQDLNVRADAQASLGDRVADSLARIGGSWPFILAFIAFLVFWTLGNVVLLGREEFDPYPFVFLNLILSMLAALQAPVIMMSQNRQAERDRLDAANDYAVNLKAEIEILALHEKLDEMRAGEIAALSRLLSQTQEAVARIDARLSAHMAATAP